MGSSLTQGKGRRLISETWEATSSHQHFQRKIKPGGQTFLLSHHHRHHRRPNRSGGKTGPWNFPQESSSLARRNWAKATWAKQSLRKWGDVKGELESPRNRGHRKGRGYSWGLGTAQERGPGALTNSPMLSLKHQPCSRHYAGRFRSCRFLFKKLPGRTATPLLGYFWIHPRSPCIRTSRGEETRTTGPNSWTAPGVPAAAREGASKAALRRCRGRGWRVEAAAPQPSSWVYWLESLHRLPLDPRASRTRPGSLASVPLPPAPLLPHEAGERTGPCRNGSGEPSVC